MKKKEPIAKLRWKIPEEVMKDLDGLQLGDLPFLIAFRHKDGFHVIRGKYWSLEEAYNLLIDLAPEADEIWNKTKEGADYYIR